MKTRKKTNSNSSSKTNHNKTSTALNTFNEIHYFKRPLRKGPSPNTRTKPEKFNNNDIEK